MVRNLYLQKGGDPKAQLKELEHKIREMVRRRRAEGALDSSQQMLQLILDSIPQRVIWKDKELTYIGCNKNAANEVGLSKPRMLIGKNDHDIVDGDSAERCRADDRQVMESGIAKMNFEEKLIRPDGEVRWLRTSKVPLRDADGGIIGIMGACEDITERKHADMILKESEERYRSLYLDNRDAIIIFSSERGFIAGNPATIRLFGCRNEKEFLGQTPTSMSPKHQPDGSLSVDKSREMISLARANGTHSFDWIHRRLDGTEFPSTVLLSRLNGGEQLYQATVRDITESKKVERALKESEEKFQRSSIMQMMLSMYTSSQRAGHQGVSSMSTRSPVECWVILMKRC